MRRESNRRNFHKVSPKRLNSLQLKVTKTQLMGNKFQRNMHLSRPWQKAEKHLLKTMNQNWYPWSFPPEF